MRDHHAMGSATRLLAVGLLMLGLLAPVSARAQDSGIDKAQAARAGKTLVFAGSGGGLGDTLKKIMADFTDQTGIRVNYLAGPLLDLYGRIRAERNRPSIDVYFSSSVSEAKGVEEALFAPLDPRMVPNLQYVVDASRVKDNLGVRLSFTDLGIIYNKKALAERGMKPIEVWEDVWADNLKGHVIIGDTTSFYTVLYLALMNQKLGGKESDPTRGVDYVAARKPNLLAVVRTYPERIHMLTTGQAWATFDVGMTSIPEVVKHKDLAYVSPRDGSALFWNSLHAVKGSPNPVGAQILINYLIGEPAQTRWANESFVSPVNKGASLPPEIAQLVPDFVRDKDRLVTLDNGIIGDSLNKYRELWDKSMAPR